MYPCGNYAPLLLTTLLLLARELSCTIPAGQSPITDSPNREALQACDVLASLFPSLVTFPNNSQYQSQQSRYWASNQADFTPACRLSPTTSEQASSLIARLSGFDNEVHFAISSGGHTTTVGASNVDDGITLDLSGLNAVSLTHDGSFVDVGTGARWLDVYQLLDPLRLTVAGGRAASVGVGGYLLGGGIPMFPSLHGWGVDSLESIEVVLFNGTLIHASETTHSDLFSSLKGGTNNFGIATTFRMRTFPLHDDDGRLQVTFLGYAHEHIAQVLAALTEFSHNAHLDVSSASAELSVGFDGSSSPVREPVYVLMLARLSSSSTERDEPPDPPLPPTLWEPFLRIPALHVSTWRPTMSELAEKIDLDNPYGFRIYKSTMTIRNDAALVTRITDLFTTSVQEFREYSTDDGNNSNSHGPDPFLAGMLVQPLPLPHLQHAGRGHNLMCLEDETAPLLLLSFEAHHLSPLHDARFTALMASIQRRAEELAREQAALHAFRYVNYAAATQDVWELLRTKDHGERAEWVKQVKTRYDPLGVWERRGRGGFKVLRGI